MLSIIYLTTGEAGIPGKTHNERPQRYNFASVPPHPLSGSSGDRNAYNLFLVCRIFTR